MKNKIVFVEANTTGTGMLAIKIALDLGFEAVLLTTNKNIYKGISGLGCRVIDINTNSIEAIKNCIIQENVEKIAGILTTSDFYLETVAELVEEFKLRGNKRHSIRICRNKATFRKKLSEKNILQPRFNILRSVNYLKILRSSIQTPCVVKPAEGSGSNDVRLCSSWEEIEYMTNKILKNKLNARGQEIQNTVLIEEFIEGPEYSVEMFSWEGHSICVGITEKRLTGFPYFVESGHIFPSSLPENVKLEIEQTVKRALQAVGFQFGASHSEIKWTPEGCVIIEINARLAGGMIPELIRYSTGVDLLKQQLLTSVSVAPDWKKIKHENYAGIHFLTSKKSGILTEIIGIDKVSRLSYVKEIVINNKIGQTVEKPENFSHRLGHVIVQGKTYDEVSEFLEEIEKNLEVEVMEQNE
ncbi:ATP-grasp domain-containing protein [Bacillus sp. ISL-53]|nr:ATP-grasp domain-containing protein [Bacillus sp. ISL-53]